jgi:deoxyribonuclease V
MKQVITHKWNIEKNVAIQIQDRLASHVIMDDAIGDVNCVAGVDVCYDKHSNLLIAAIVIMDIQSFQVIDTLTTQGLATFPYIPGLFAFREIPPLIDLFESITHAPDLIVCDGQGLAHPRRFGLACHLGVLFDLPAIGCAKTHYIGVESGNLSSSRGSRVDLVDHNETIGAKLRTQDDVKPVYVSIGHRISLTTACKWILELSPSYRIPEPIRMADQAVRQRLKEIQSHSTAQCD